MNPLVGVPWRKDGQTNQKKGNQVIRRRKRVQPGTKTIQTNLIVHRSWQLSSIALRELELDEGKNQDTDRGKIERR